MTRPLVAFTSRHGSTRHYATALAQRLGVSAIDLADPDSARGAGRNAVATARDADPVIVLAPIYVTRIIRRAALIRAIRSAPGRVALVVVGISPTDDPDRDPVAARLVAASGRAVTTFHLRGDLDPDRLDPRDRALMSVLRWRLRRTPDAPAARLLLTRQPLSFVDDSALDPVVDWTRKPPTP